MGKDNIWHKRYQHAGKITSHRGFDVRKCSQAVQSSGGVEETCERKK